MSLAANVNNVAFYSGYSVDKIVRIFSGSFVTGTDTITRSYTLAASPNSVSFYRIPHGLTRPVACEMLWSVDNTTFLDGGVFNSSNYSTIAYSDSTYVYIFVPLSSGGAYAGTVYYKVWCNWIDDYDTTNPWVTPITYSDNPLQFDTRENYQKIYTYGELSFAAGTAGSQSTQSVTHPFTYYPNAKVFFEAFSNEVWPLNSGGTTNPFLVDDTQDTCQLSIGSSTVDVTLERFSNTVKRAWYKVYYDQT